MWGKTNIVKDDLSLLTPGNSGYGVDNIPAIILEMKYTLTVSLNEGPEGQQQNKYLHFFAKEFSFKSVQAAGWR